MELRKLTPILHVEEIEPCLPFWTERLGFEKTVEVPEGDRIGFAILQRGGIEVMYQSTASLEADDARLAADLPMRGSILFLEVDDIETIERAMDGIEPAVPRRKTFYGADELFVREPGGHLVGFAQLGTRTSGR